MKKYCLNTRRESEPKEFKAILDKEGFEVIDFSCLEFFPAASSEEILKKLKEASGKDSWLIFTSSNGVDFCFNDIANFNFLKDYAYFAAIGEKTKQSLEKLGFKVSFYPKVQTSKGFLKEFSDFHSTQNTKSKLSLFRGDKANTFLPAELKKAGFSLEETVCYISSLPDYSKELVEEKLSLAIKNKALIFILSGQTGRNLKEFAELAGNWEELKNLNVAVIGPTTEREVSELGFNVKLVASRADISVLAREADLLGI